MIERIIARITGKIAIIVGTPEGTETRYEQPPANAGENYLIEKLTEEIRKNPGATKIEISDGKKGYLLQSW